MFPFLCQVFIFVSPSFHLLSKSTQVHKFLPTSLSNLSFCQFLHFLPEGQKWGAGTSWQRAGSREAAASPAQQRLAQRSQPAAGAGLHLGLRAPPGARLPAGRAPGWNSRQSSRRTLGRCGDQGSAPGQCQGTRRNPRTFRPVCEADPPRTKGPEARPPHFCHLLRSFAPRRTYPAPLPAPPQPQTPKGS